MCKEATISRFLAHALNLSLTKHLLRSIASNKTGWLSLDDLYQRGSFSRVQFRAQQRKSYRENLLTNLLDRPEATGASATVALRSSWATSEAVIGRFVNQSTIAARGVEGNPRAVGQEFRLSQT